MCINVSCDNDTVFIFLKIPRLVDSRPATGTIENESGMSVVAESKDILKKKDRSCQMNTEAI